MAKVEIKYEKLWLGDSYLKIDGKDVLKGETGGPGYVEDIRIVCDVNDHRPCVKITFGVYPDELDFQGVLDVFPQLKDSIRYYRPRRGPIRAVILSWLYSKSFNAYAKRDTWWKRQVWRWSRRIARLLDWGNI